MGRFIIEGDTAEHRNCLMYLCGATRERAESVLERILTNPDEGDLEYLKTHSNIRVSYEESGWWDNDYRFLSNN